MAAYGFQAQAFVDLALAMREHPDGVPRRPDRLRDLGRLYFYAANDLFRLMGLILAAQIAASPRGERYHGFIEIYQVQVNAGLAELEPFLFGDDIRTLWDFLEGVRRSAIAEEMVALGNAVAPSSAQGPDLAIDAGAATTVTNSLKEQILRRVKNPWLTDIFHAINEVIGVVRAVA